MFKLQQHLVLILSTLTLSTDDLSSEISVFEEEASSLSSVYSSVESSSQSSSPNGGRNSYRRGYQDAQRNQYGQIPRRRRF